MDKTVDTVLDKWDLERAKAKERRRAMEATSNKVMAIFFGCELCAFVLFLLWVMH